MVCLLISCLEQKSFRRWKPIHVQKASGKIRGGKDRGVWCCNISTPPHCSDDNCTPDPWTLSCINVLRQHQSVFNVDCADASFLEIGIEDAQFMLDSFSLKTNHNEARSINDTEYRSADAAVTSASRTLARAVTSSSRTLASASRMIFVFGLSGQTRNDEL